MRLNTNNLCVKVIEPVWTAESFLGFEMDAYGN